MEINWTYLLSGVALFAASFLFSVLVVGFVLVQLPATYFLQGPKRQLWADRHPVMRLLFRIAKSLLGLALVLVGILLSLPGIPGQGLLTVLIGLMLLEFPGKRRLMRRIVSRPRVLSTINLLRNRFGKPALEVAEPPED